MRPDIESRLADASAAMSDLVDNGLAPNEALEKAARDADLGPGHVRLLANAFNAARTAIQLDEGIDAIEKAASFPLADADAVTARLFPTPDDAEAEKAASAVAVVYVRPPAPRADTELRLAPRVELAVDVGRVGSDAIKAAAVVRELTREVDTRLARYDIALRTIDDRRAEAEEGVRTCVAKLAAALATLDGPSADDIRPNAHALFGAAADVLLDRACRGQRRLSKVAGVGRLHATADHPVPYQVIADAIKYAQHAVVYDAAYIQLAAERHALKTAHRAALTPAPEPDDLDEVLGVALAKEAALAEDLRRALVYSSVGSAVGGLGGDLRNARDPYEKRRDEFYNAVATPDHEEDIRRIRTGAMLQDLLTNDPVISGHGDPTEVAEIYNEIARSAPRLADQPLVMRAALRRALQSPPELFDVGEILKMEKIRSEVAPYTTSVAPYPKDTVNDPWKAAPKVPDPSGGRDPASAFQRVLITGTLRDLPSPKPKDPPQPGGSA